MDKEIGRIWKFNLPVTAPPTSIHRQEITGKEKIHYSQGNPFQKLGQTRERIGGNFLVERHEMVQNSTAGPIYAATISAPSASWQRFKGNICALTGVGVNDWPAPVIPSDIESDAFGTTAIANVEPTNPLSGLAVALGELKADGLPSLPGIHTWRPRTWTAKNAGSEYLNKEFGWVPLLSDIRSFSDTASNSDLLVEQYARNSGRKIKRQFSLPSSTEVLATTSGSGYTAFSPNLDPGFHNSTPQWTETETLKRIRWFEGCFTYYLPTFDPNGSNFRRNRLIANKLYDARVTPETVWNLAPWTWAADWLGNFGDVIHNVTAFRDTGLVMQYGYVMETTIHERQRTVSNITFKNLPNVRHSVTTTLRNTVKYRRTATPYGFGLDTSSFTGKQWAILAALGMSRN